jgi:hypothetical protein
MDEKQKIIQSIRANFLFFGIDLSEFTDEEIKIGIINAQKVFIKTGVTCEQAANALAGVFKNG